MCVNKAARVIYEAKWTAVIPVGPNFSHCLMAGDKSTARSSAWMLLEHKAGEQGTVYLFDPLEIKSCCWYSPWATPWFRCVGFRGVSYRKSRSWAQAIPGCQGCVNHTALCTNTTSDLMSLSFGLSRCFSRVPRFRRRWWSNPDSIFSPTFKWKQNWAQWALRCGMTGGRDFV